ncbi:MAG: glycosyltransferase family 39 protein [Candidatus Gastranaerophilales bacterium]|nr:glycosyltransferase family 39 protein [Candidatus Gastranaerophilales bacterium]
MEKFMEIITKNKWLFWTVFAVIIILGLGLRLSIIHFPLWYDEGCSIATAINSFPAGINDYLWNHDLQHTPFYFYILHYIMQFFGDSEVVLRVSSLIVGIALLPVTYIVAEKLSSSRKVALLAMLMMSVNTFQVLYSIEIRMYPHVMLLALLSINYLIDYDRKGDISSLIKLGIVNVLNPYFLTGSIVFVIAQFIVYTSYLDAKKADKKLVFNYVISNLITLLCLIPYFVIVGHYAIVRSTFLVTDLSKFEFINVLGLLQNLFAADPGHIHETRHEAFPVGWQTICLVLLPIIYMFIGLFNSLKDKEKLNSVILGIVGLAFGIFCFLSSINVIAFTGRYLIFIAPLLFILTAVGLRYLKKAHVIAFAVFYLIACVYGLSQTYNLYKRIAYFSLEAPADFVRKHTLGKDNLVIMPFASSVSFYYFKGEDMPRVMPLELFHEVRNPENENFYSDAQIKAFKTEDKYQVFQKIILDNGFISDNFVRHIKKELDRVPSGGYIVWVVYYTDNYAIQPENVVKQVYSNIENVKNHTMTGMMSKFDIDLIKLIAQQANFIMKDRDDSNQYFVFQKR